MIPVTALLEAVKTDVFERFPDLRDKETELRSPTRYACAALIEGLLKKQTDILDVKACDRTAIDTFLNVNAGIKGFTPNPQTAREKRLFGLFKHQVELFFDKDPLINDWVSVAARGDLGTGASLDASGTDYYSKLFSSVPTATEPLLYFVYKRWCERHPMWSDAENARKVSTGEQCSIVKHGKIGTVRKNDRTSRVIETQPILNMFLQRGVSNHIEDMLKRRFRIDLAIQPDVNRELARRGSVDGSLSTIDLSSASDHVSLGLFEAVVPPAYWQYFAKTRVVDTQLPAAYGGGVVRLNMLSSMGNGYTFSFQTMLFCCMVEAAMVENGVRTQLESFTVNGRSSLVHSNWGVFGDDIICPTGLVTADVLTLLAVCGFKTNASKTFVIGPFRESCGCDYVRGVNVRPVHIISLKTRESRYVAINRLLEWSAYHGVTLRRAVRLLHESLPHAHYVPWSFGYDSGIRVDLPTYMRLVNKPRRSTRYHGTLMVTYRHASSPSMKVYEDRIEVPRGEVPRRYISSGVLIAVLRGNIRQAGKFGSMVSRAKTIRYRTEVAPAPNWVPDQNQGRNWPRLWGTALRSHI